MKQTLLVLLYVCFSTGQEVCQKDNLYEEEDCSAGETSERLVKLSNGVLMPEIGYGTWKVTADQEIFKVLDASLAAGYRLIDTAVAYHNHRLGAGRCERHHCPLLKGPSPPLCRHCYPSTI